MLLYSFGIGVLMLNVISSRMSSAQECADATQITQNLTCDFGTDTCGWIKIFNSRYNVSKNWTQTDNGVLHAQMAYDESANIIARIKSGLVCSTKFGSFLLQAKYTIQPSNETCELSAYLVTDYDKNFTLLWRDSMVTTGAFSGVPSETFKVDIRSENKFKVVIQVKKLRDKANCDVWLGGTTFAYKDTLPTSTTTAATPVVDRKVDEGLSGGGIAGIIVGLIIVVALCVFLFLLIHRRNAGGDIPLPSILKRLKENKQSTPQSTTSTGSVCNSAHVGEGQRYTTTTTRTKPQIPGPMRVEAPHLGPGFEWKSQSSEDDVMESSNYYSMPVDDDDGNCVPLAHVNERAKRGTADYDVAVLPESDGGYCTPDDVDAKDSSSSSSRAQVGAPRANAASGGGSNYNKLSLQTPQGGYPKTKNTDTYSHIQEQDNVYKVPKSGAGSVYSLATNREESDGRPSARANAGVKGKGATAAPSERADYHHLNLKDGRSATPDASRGQGQKGGVYSHLSNQGEAGDNYNRVEFDKHTQQKQSAQCDEPYNHLSGNQV